MRIERCSLSLAMEVIGDFDLSRVRSPELCHWRTGDKNLIGVGVGSRENEKLMKGNSDF